MLATDSSWVKSNKKRIWARGDIHQPCWLGILGGKEELHTYIGYQWTGGCHSGYSGLPKGMQCTLLGYLRGQTNGSKRTRTSVGEMHYDGVGMPEDGYVTVLGQQDTPGFGFMLEREMVDLEISFVGSLPLVSPPSSPPQMRSD